MTKQTSLPTKIVHNPARTFIYGIVWLAIAIFAGSALIGVSSEGISVHEVSGQRTPGVILTLPFIAVGVSIVCLVRGSLGVARYKTYMRTTTPALRQKLKEQAWKHQGPPTYLMVLFTILSYAGFFTLLLVLILKYPSISTSMGGIALFISLLLIVGLLVSFFTELSVRIVQARSRTR